jgi:hypothetical protein
MTMRELDGALAAELLRSGRAVEIVVGGESMWPLLQSGWRVRIEPAPARVGDLVAVERDGHLVVHRLVKLEGERATLRGDNTGRDDPPARTSDLLGVVTAVWTSSGRCLSLTKRRWNMVGRAVAHVATRTHRPWRWALRLARWRHR